MKKILLLASFSLFLLVGLTAHAQSYNLALSPVENKPLQVSCTVDKTSVKINESVNYKVIATGGDGKYSYSWTTAPGFNLDKIEKKYPASGEKRETVKITSSFLTMTVNCPSVRVSAEPFVPFSASCDVQKKLPIVGEEVMYKVSAKGGDGKYVYSWSNGVGISSNVRSIKYETVGVKEMSVKVTSGKDTVEAKCPSVDVQPKYKPIQASCGVLEKKIHYVGDQVNWRVTATGGDGKYIYSWSDGVGVSSPVRTMKYETPGTKSMSVKVSSLNEVLEVKCAPIEIKSKIQQLEATCTVNKPKINEGESVTYNVRSMGGVKPHNYSWNITEIAQDNSNIRQKAAKPIVPTVRDNDRMTATYQTAGSKNVSVTVSSSANQEGIVIQPVEVKCPIVEVVKKTAPQLTASCTVNKTKALIDETVNYRVVSSGGIMPHAYTWSVAEVQSTAKQAKKPTPQTDKLAMSFQTLGPKSVNVTVNSSTSPDQKIEVKCPIVEISAKNLPPITIDPNKFNDNSYKLEIVATVFGKDSEIYKTVSSMINKSTTKI